MTKEEAIRRIKSWNLDSDDMEVLSVVIPELAESEDEKIRKELLEEIEFIVPHENETDSEGLILPSYRTRIDRYKSYLEKQKEQKEEELSTRLNGVMQEYVKAGKDEEEQEYRLKCYQLFWDALGDSEFFEHFLYRGLEIEKNAVWRDVELTFRGENVKVKRQFFRDDKGHEYSTTEQDENVAWYALRAWCEKKGVSLYDLYPREELSEKDKEMLMKVEQIVLKHWNILSDSFYHKNDDENQDAESCYNWHKSLPLNLKKKNDDATKLCSNEWSEKEQTIIDGACNALEVHGHYKLADNLKSLRPQSHKEIYQAAKHDLAIKFMNYMDENRPKNKMCLSNSECEDIDKAFKENDWAKIVRYVEKFMPHWEPSEEQMDTLRDTVKNLQNIPWAYNPLKELYEQLNKQKNNIESL